LGYYYESIELFNAFSAFRGFSRKTWDMAINFLIHRVFCSTPGDLEELRRIFDHEAGVVNEAVGMPRQVLLAPVSCRPATGTGFFNAEIRENIRQCSFFVQVLGDSWGPPAAELQRAYELAIACRDDPRLPMREVVVFLEDVPAERSAADAIEFWQSIQKHPECNVFPFRDSEDFRRLLDDQLRRWLDSITSTRILSLKRDS